MHLKNLNKNDCNKVSEFFCLTFIHWLDSLLISVIYSVASLFFFSTLLFSYLNSLHEVSPNPKASYLNSSGLVNPLKYRPFLRERARASASQERAKRERGSRGPNSKKLSPQLFCRWRQKILHNNRRRTNAPELVGPVTT